MKRGSTLTVAHDLAAGGLRQLEVLRPLGQVLRVEGQTIGLRKWVKITGGNIAL